MNTESGGGGSATQAFVGRTRELAELGNGLQDAAAGSGRLFLIVGAAGIGKTRLAEELAVEAGRGGARVLWGRCWEGGGAPAYWPWIELIRTLLRDLPPETVQDLIGNGASYVAQVVPELREHLRETPPLATPSVVDPEPAQFPLFDAVATFLKNAAAVQPLVIVLDDLHDADEPSLLLLQFLVQKGLKFLH